MTYSVYRLIAGRWEHYVGNLERRAAVDLIAWLSGFGVEAVMRSDQWHGH